MDNINNLRKIKLILKNAQREASKEGVDFHKEIEKGFAELGFYVGGYGWEINGFKRLIKKQTPKFRQKLFRIGRAFKKQGKTFDIVRILGWVDGSRVIRNIEYSDEFIYIDYLNSITKEKPYGNLRLIPSYQKYRSVELSPELNKAHFKINSGTWRYNRVDCCFDFFINGKLCEFVNGVYEAYLF